MNSDSKQALRVRELEQLLEAAQRILSYEEDKTVPSRDLRAQRNYVTSIKRKLTMARIGA
jgi:hypothetical protein